MTLDGLALHAAAARLRGAASAFDAAGCGVRTEAAGALGGDAWLGSAARAAQLARARPATITDQLAALLRRAAAALDSLGTVAADANRERWHLDGESLLPSQVVAVRATERDADAAAAAVLREVTAELLRLRLRAGHPVDALVDPAPVMLLRRIGVLSAPSGPAVSVRQAAAEIRELLRGGDRVAVHAYMESLPIELRRALVATHAQLTGSGDGVPPPMRYAANRLVMARAHAQARRRGETALAGRLAEWLRPDRQFLLVDLAGGRVAEVLGDLDSAAHVAVLVPGVGNRPANFDAGLAASARRLHEHVSRSVPGLVATIAWLGYRTPGVAMAPFDNDARAAAGRLRDVVAGLVLRAGVSTTVVAHSYGSLVTGHAVREGLRVDAVVVLGSPGMGTRTAAELQAPAGTRLFAARAPGDPVGWSENFGRDPADPRFGIPRIATGDPRAGGPTGHSGYVRGDTECMRNLSRIVTGKYDRVTVVRPDRLEQLAGPASTLVEATGAGTAALRGAERTVASVLPARLERRALDVIEAQERADRLARRLRDPDLYAQITGEARSLKK